MPGLSVRSVSLIHGVFAASARAGVTKAARGTYANLAGGYRRNPSGIRLAWVMAVALLFAFGAMATAQTAVFNNWGNTIVPGIMLGANPALAVDANGNFYIPGAPGGGVWEYTPSGGGIYTQTTLSFGLNGPVGVAVDSSGNLYLATLYSGVVKETLSGGGYTASTIYPYQSYAIAVNAAGNVYFTTNCGNGNAYSGCLIEETPTGGSYVPTVIADVSTYVGSAQIGVGSPSGVAADSSGNVYFSDFGTGSVYKFTPNGSSYTGSVVVGGLSYPVALAADGSGNVYVGDQTGNVTKETPSGGGYTQSLLGVQGMGGGNCIAVDSSGNLYVFGSPNNTSTDVLEVQTGAVNFGAVAVGTTSAPITLTFNLLTVEATGPTSVLTLGATGLDFAEDINGGDECQLSGTAAGHLCNMDITFTPGAAGSRYGAVNLVNNSLGVIASAYVQGTGVGPQVVFNPGTVSTLGASFFGGGGVAVDGIGNIYVAETSPPNSAIKEIPVGCVSSTCVIALGGGFNEPTSVALDGGGNIYVADYVNSAIKEIPVGCFSSTCVITLGGGFNYPEGVAVDGSGNVYVGDTANSAVKEMPAGCVSSACVTTLGGGFDYPQGVAVDGNGNVYLNDYFHSAVKEIPPGCVSSSCVITLGGDFYLPQGVAVDGGGNIYVVDTGNFAVKEMPPGCASASCVNTLDLGYLPPSSVGIDAEGNVYFSNQNGLQEIQRATAPSLSLVATTDVGSPGSASPPAVTLQNIGNAPLTFPILSAGDNPSITTGFTLNSSEPGACPLVTAVSHEAGTLAADASCLLPISFTAGTEDSMTGSLVLTDTNLNAASPNYAVQTIQLNGSTAPSSPTITAVSTIIPQQTQTITITGSGFGSQAAYTGDSNYIGLTDLSETSWTAGQTGDNVILAVSSWTDSQIVITGLDGNYGGAHCIRPGDHLSVSVWNAQTGNGPAVYPVVAGSGANTCPPIITSVSPIASQQTQTITITGSAFGSQSAYTGDSSYISLADLSGTPWYAGQGEDGVTLAVSSWTDSQIVLTGFSGSYGTAHCIHPGDQLAVSVWNAQTGVGPAVYPIVAASGTDTCAPAIASVSAIVPQETQTITITGEGFGTRVAYTGDSSYIEVTDSTRSWNAGNTGDTVNLGISSWTDSRIVLTGFSGNYSPTSHCIAPGDQLSVKVWNAQSGAGPATYSLVASNGTSTCP